MLPVRSTQPLRMLCTRASFLLIAQHDYTLPLVFKYHPPEVIDSVLKVVSEWKCTPPSVCSPNIGKG